MVNCSWNWLNPNILTMICNHFLFLQGCDFWDWKWRPAAADPSGSASCFPFKTPHQWRPREWADGAQGPGQCERTYKLFTGRVIKRHSCLRRTTLYTHFIRGVVILSWLSPCCSCSLGSSSQKRIQTTACLCPGHPPSWHHNTRRHPSPRSSLKT